MDSSDLQSTNNSTKTMPNDIADNSSMNTPSKRDIFFSTYRSQRFTLRDSMMQYIAMNPKNTNVYLKMIKRCKYFFIKNPILVIDELYYDHNGWKIFVSKTWITIDMNKLSSKLWITNTLFVYAGNVSNNSVASSIVPKIYRCDVKRLNLLDQVISLNELIFLCSSIKELDLRRITVKNDDDTVVLFEEFVKQLPQLKKITYTFPNPSRNTLKELWKIPHLSNYKCLELFNIPEDFDIESYYSYMKKNKKTRIVLEFSDTISEEFKTRLKAIIDELFAIKNYKFKPPFIEFPGHIFVA